MTNRKFLMFLVTHTITKLLKDYTFNICCMNCNYYWCNSYYGYCKIDNQNIPCELSHIIKCNAFELWFGAID